MESGCSGHIRGDGYGTAGMEVYMRMIQVQERIIQKTA